MFRTTFISLVVSLLLCACSGGGGGSSAADGSTPPTNGGNGGGNNSGNNGGNSGGNNGGAGASAKSVSSLVALPANVSSNFYGEADHYKSRDRENTQVFISEGDVYIAEGALRENEGDFYHYRGGSAKLILEPAQFVDMATVLNDGDAVRIEFSVYVDGALFERKVLSENTSFTYTNNSVNAQEVTVVTTLFIAQNALKANGFPVIGHNVNLNIAVATAKQAAAEPSDYRAVVTFHNPPQENKTG